MEERYWFCCYKDNKKAGKGKTWREVLQYIFEELNSPTTKRNKYGWYDVPKAYGPAVINDYFRGWRHHVNDGGYWTNGAYDRIFVGFDPETNQKIEINGDWHDPEWKVKEGGTYLTDSYGRIIPSGYVKACYLRFRPDTSVKKKDHRYWYYNRGYKRHHTAGWNTGNHAGFVPWKRSWYAHDVDRKEIYEEYGIMLRTQKIIPYTCGRTEGHGWKRTKKQKQWM
jgi:hypothetical protein